MNRSLLYAAVGLSGLVLSTGLAFGGHHLSLPSLPPVNLPPIKAPSLPPVNLPPIKAPSLPPVNLPPINLPPVNLPPIKAPPVSLPPVSLPPIKAPSITLPQTTPSTFDDPPSGPNTKAPNTKPNTSNGPALGTSAPPLKVGPSSSASAPPLVLGGSPPAAGNAPPTANTPPAGGAPSTANTPPAPGTTAAGNGSGNVHNSAGDVTYFHHHKWIYTVANDSGGQWVDNGAVVDSQQQVMRTFRVKNNTDATLTVHMVYQYLNADNEWVWSDERVVTYDPGQESFPTNEGACINAVRIKVWAEGDDGRRWYRDKEDPRWLVAETDEDGNHVYYAPQMGKYTMNFK